MADNPNCDGGHCLFDTGEVRVYPLGGGANLILCRACVGHENRYRAERGQEHGRPDDWPQQTWDELKPYPEAS